MNSRKVASVVFATHQEKRLFLHIWGSKLSSAGLRKCSEKEGHCVVPKTWVSTSVYSLTCKIIQHRTTELWGFDGKKLSLLVPPEVIYSVKTVLCNTFCLKSNSCKVNYIALCLWENTFYYKLIWRKKYYTMSAIKETVMSCFNSIYKSNHCTSITLKPTYIRLLELCMSKTVFE